MHVDVFPHFINVIYIIINYDVILVSQFSDLYYKP